MVEMESRRPWERNNGRKKDQDHWLNTSSSLETPSLTLRYSAKSTDSTGDWIVSPHPPNSYVEALHPQCNTIWRWGLWEVIRFWWGHEGRTPLNTHAGISPSYEGTPESLLSPRPVHKEAVRGHSKMAARKSALTRNPICQHLDLGLPSFQNSEK